MVTLVISCKNQRASSNCLCKRRNEVGWPLDWNVDWYLDPGTQMMVVWFSPPLSSIFLNMYFILRQAHTVWWPPATVSFPVASVATPDEGREDCSSLQILLQRSQGVPRSFVIAPAWSVC